MSLIPSGPGERPKRSCSARPESEGRVSLAAVFHGEAEVDRRCPGAVHRSVCSDPDVLQAEPAGTIRAEDDLEPVLADVRWMSFAVVSFSAVTAEAGPKPSPASLPLTKMSPATLGVTELREK